MVLVTASIHTESSTKITAGIVKAADKPIVLQFDYGASVFMQPAEARRVIKALTAVLSSLEDA